MTISVNVVLFIGNWDFGFIWDLGFGYSLSGGELWRYENM
jgi:hypothetical protein